ncbi:Hypp8903 [Branchiostoma lanceolatum]|uniref:Hypp8903 protein n=1 Tax=Branchiostoma lanceolatum TaxID=7740 RepID=A0A8J9ZBN9_BRALA|nr:Hypp8903 [Branchiostoma lanceolatum]
MSTVEFDPGTRSEQLWQVARVDSPAGQRTALYVPVPRVAGRPQVAWTNKRSSAPVSSSWARYHTPEIAGRLRFLLLLSVAMRFLLH